MEEMRKGLNEPVFKEFAEKTAEKVQSASERSKRVMEYAEQKAAEHKVAEKGSALKEQLGEQLGEAATKTQKAAGQATESVKSVSQNRFIQMFTSTLMRAIGLVRNSVDSFRSISIESSKSRVGNIQRAASEKMEQVGATATEGAKQSFEFIAKKTGKRVNAKAAETESFKEDKKEKDARENVILPLRPAPTDALVLYQRELEWYEQYATEMMTNLERTKYYKRMHRQLLAFRRTKMFKRLSTTTSSFSERVAEYQEAWDTTQNPIIWKVRDLQDKITMESDFAHCVKAIRQTWPDFWPEDFLEEFENNIAPITIKKYLEGDAEWLAECCEGEAEQFLFANFKERETLGHVYDDAILWIEKPWVDDKTTILDEKVPLLTIHITAQHLSVIRNEDGDIVEGSVNSIMTAYYVFSLTPCPELESVVGFPWKIMRFHTQRQHALV